MGSLESTAIGHGIAEDLKLAAVESATGPQADVEKASCMIDDKRRNEEDYESLERICRICHDDPQLSETKDVIVLGCGCKGQMGYAHSLCAATWFQLRGNRLCEICGQTAENVMGIVEHHRFMARWDGNELIGEEGGSMSERSWWQGQTFCNLLMAFMVIVFVVPLVLRVNVF